MAQKITAPREWFRVTCEAAADSADVRIFGAIGSGYGDDAAVSAKQFVDALHALPERVRTIRLHVNSPGGDVFDGVAISQALRQEARDRKRSIEVTIDGLAASAASIVTSAGDTIKIGDNAMIMIHNPSGLVWGPAAAMRKTADELDRIRDASIITAYQWHSPLSADELRALMDATTWMDATEALAKGFATEIVPGLQATACLDPRSLHALGTIPERFRLRVHALIRAAEADWRVGGARDLPLDEDRAWDGDAADLRVRRWASTDGSGDKDRMDWPKYRKAFVAYDAANAEGFAGYKLGFADVVDGALTAIKAGLVACRAVLNGGRGGVDLPEDIIEKAKAFVDGYLGPSDAQGAVNAAAAASDGDVLAAVDAAGFGLPFARNLLDRRLPLAQVAARIAEAKEIRALCAMAGHPERTEQYLRAGVSVEFVKDDLTYWTAKLDLIEIDASLPPDAGGAANQTRLNPSAVYAERAARAGQRGA